MAGPFQQTICGAIRHTSSRSTDRASTSPALTPGCWPYRHSCPSRLTLPVGTARSCAQRVKRLSGSGRISIRRRTFPYSACRARPARDSLLSSRRRLAPAFRISTYLPNALRSSVAIARDWSTRADRFGRTALAGAQRGSEGHTRSCPTLAPRSTRRRAVATAVVLRDEMLVAYFGW